MTMADKQSLYKMLNRGPKSIYFLSTGFIGEEYLKECLMTMGDRWSEEMVDELFHGAPISEGLFDYNEFTRTLKYGKR